MKVREIAQRFALNIQNWSKGKIAAVTGGLLIVSYVIMFVVPRHVEFSYASQTCVGRWMLFPSLQKAVGSGDFAASYSGGFSVGQTKVLSTRLCFVPQQEPQEGTTSVSIAPWGGPIFRANYVIGVGKIPHVVGSQITVPIAITKPALYSIDTSDTVYTYQLASGKKTSDCTVKNTTIECGLQQLELEQGAEHTVALQRSFNGKNARPILSSKLTILPAVTIESSTPTNGQIIYDKPTSFSIVTNKNLVHATGDLVQLDGDTKTSIKIDLTTKDKTVTASLGAELPREKTFVFTLKSAEATDGSTIPQPYIVTFSTSGGPKVSGVSVGTTGVDPNARIVVTLDQAVADSVDIAKFAHIQGVNATISKTGNQVVFGLKGAERCTAFTLSLDKGITSGTNGLVSQESWKYTSRINCKATSVIGYSVKGRPITAYYYGSGATTILFTGNIHGNEKSAYQTMLGWASYLDVNAYKLPAGKQVVIVPTANPDGYATNSRYNANTVNIARNFPTSDWNKDIDTGSGILAGGGGSAPASEPETRALINLTSQLNPRLEVSFHSQGRLVGANGYADSQSIGNTYASLVGYSTMFGGSEEDVMGYSITGEYEDWIGEQLGKPAILIELPSNSGNYFSSQQTALWRMVNL